MRERHKILMAAVLLVLLSALPAVAQTGRIGGLVKDDKGEPVKGATVKAEIVAQTRGKKIIVFKFRRRKNYRRKAGHRQPYTQVKITGIKA